MSKKAKLSIGILAAVLIIGLLVFATIYKNRKIHNPEGTVGTTNGNLYDCNNGYFAEYEGRVYFANAYDGNALYSMRPDGTDMKKLTKVPVSRINVAGGYVYFYQTGASSGSDLGSVIRSMGIYRCTTSGKDIKCLYKGVVFNMLLVEDYIYFHMYDKARGNYFCRVDVNGERYEELIDSYVAPGTVWGTDILYAGTQDDHNLYRYDTKTGTSTRLYSGSVWCPVYQDGYVYYMDTANHRRLCRLNLSNATLTVLTQDTVDYFVAGSDHIFYQTTRTEPSALKRVSLDGSSETVIAYGVYTGLNMTEDFVYYRSTDDSYPVYRVPAYGSTSVTVFNEAKSAAMGQ